MSCGKIKKCFGKFLLSILSNQRIFVVDVLLTIHGCWGVNDFNVEWTIHVNMIIFKSLLSPYGKSTSECLSPIPFYTVIYTYIDSLNQRGQVSSFKTLKMRAAQSLATNLTNVSKIRNLRCSFGGKLLRGSSKVIGDT